MTVSAAAARLGSREAEASSKEVGEVSHALDSGVRGASLSATAAYCSDADVLCSKGNAVRLLIATMVFAFATSASADTLQEVTTRGVVVTAPSVTFDVAYTPDGKFTAMSGQVTGTWRIDGDKLCTTSSYDPNEQCVVYPKGKKSGDSFDVTGPRGVATVKIN